MAKIHVLNGASGDLVCTLPWTFELTGFDLKLAVEKSAGISNLSQTLLSCGSVLSDGDFLCDEHGHSDPFSDDLVDAEVMMFLVDWREQAQDQKVAATQALSVHGRAALHMAAQAGDDAAVCGLMVQNSHLTRARIDGRTPLEAAQRCTKPEVLKLRSILLRRVQISP
eukprot:TRINITY_DN38602_c0_g1_i1.p1 TRINITY_DN38602_c0_g1~~TRINITY_DN38602_c0_g1_i1.p1  ORF type:complete len:168 (-),score=27.00 TRINITY_DN38602_c0_g1_i1:956-1459(-)